MRFRDEDGYYTGGPEDLWWEMFDLKMETFWDQWDDQMDKIWEQQ